VRDHIAKMLRMVLHVREFDEFQKAYNILVIVRLRIVNTMGKGFYVITTKYPTYNTKL